MKFTAPHCLRILVVLSFLASSVGLAAAESQPLDSLPLPVEDLFTPAPEAKAAMCRCEMGRTTSPGSGAASHWGKGSTCNAAKANLRFQLDAAAVITCEYDHCSLAVTYTSPCYVSNGVVTIDGYATYGCWIYTGGCMLP
jgi:hypothetical protein